MGNTAAVQSTVRYLGAQDQIGVVIDQHLIRGACLIIVSCEREIGGACTCISGGISASCVSDFGAVHDALPWLALHVVV